MRAAEAASGASEWELMQRAGLGCAEWVWRAAAARPVTVLCGPGNNGGDGYVIAEALRRRGLDVAVVAPREPTTIQARQAKAAYSGPIEQTLGGRSIAVLVDAIFGSGLNRAPEGELAATLDAAMREQAYRIAIDVPSGVASDSGQWLGRPAGYDLTLALGAWKRAHWLMPAGQDMGQKRHVDLGIFSPGREAPGEEARERLAAAPRLHPPRTDWHKYTRGMVAVIAGSMPGAPMLAAEAAMRAGAGYVALVGDHAWHAPPELVVQRTIGDASRLSAVLIGPGLGRDEAARERLGEVLALRKPTVIDADALHLLDWDAIEGLTVSDLLLTPHEGELSALARAFAISGDGKIAKATGLRDALGINVLAKGPDTVLAAANGDLLFFPPASSWLSVAGSGDVLAGIAAARLAWGHDMAGAVSEAVWLHREAARIAGPAFTAGELARAVRPALAAFL